MYRLSVAAKAMGYVQGDRCSPDDREDFLRLCRALEADPYPTGRLVHGNPAIQVRVAGFGTGHAAAFVVYGAAVVPPDPQVRITHCLPAPPPGG